MRSVYRGVYRIRGLVCVYTGVFWCICKMCMSGCMGVHGRGTCYV